MPALRRIMGPTGPYVAKARTTKPNSLRGLVAPVDPFRLLNSNLSLTPKYLALFCAVNGVLALGKTSWSAKEVASVSGVPVAALELYFLRLRTYMKRLPFDPVLEEGQIVIRTWASQILRPDRYLRVEVTRLSRAPDRLTAQVMILAGIATTGRASRGTNRVAWPLSRLTRDSFTTVDIENAVDWCRSVYLKDEVGHTLKWEIDPASQELIVTAISTCHRDYHHSAAPRDWIETSDLQTYAIHDGVIDDGQKKTGLSVAWHRVAKVCTWVREVGASLTHTSVRKAWSVLLNYSLQGKSVEGFLSGPDLIADIVKRGATAAFEGFTLHLGQYCADRAIIADPSGHKLDLAWLDQNTIVRSERERMRRAILRKRPHDKRVMAAREREAFVESQVEEATRRRRHETSSNAATDQHYVDWLSLASDTMLDAEEETLEGVVSNAVHQLCLKAAGMRCVVGRAREFCDGVLEAMRWSRPNALSPAWLKLDTMWRRLGGQGNMLTAVRDALDSLFPAPETACAAPT